MSYASSTLAALLVAAALGACSYTYGGHYIPVHYEEEPNDAACCPDPIGPIGVGDELVIYGHIEDYGFDMFDGFAFQSLEPLDVEFTLSPRWDWADLDLHVYDPWLGAFVLDFDSSSSTERGRFTIPAGGTDFHLVVTSFLGSADYRLEISVWPATFATMRAVDEPAAGEESKGEPRVPLANYHGGAAAALEEPDAALTALAIEIDERTGEVRRYAIELAGDVTRVRPLDSPGGR